MKARVDVLVHLVMDGLEDFVVAMAYVVDSDAARKIDVFLSLYVCNDGSLRLLGENRVGVEGALGNVFVPFSE